MTRLIGADALKETLHNRHYNPKSWNQLFSAVMETIDNAPTVATIPENPTNGDMIRLLFPDAKVWTSFNNVYVCYSGNGDETHMYYDDWWNASYRKEEK